jgi:hypothetical protein
VNTTNCKYDRSDDDEGVHMEVHQLRVIAIALI